MQFSALFRGLALPALLLCFHTANVSAQQPTQAQADAIRQSCRSDYQAHCSSIPPGGSASLQCLKDNLSNLSPSCRTAVAATEGGTSPQGSASPPGQAPAAAPAPAISPREEMAVLRGACGRDFRTYCRGVSLGGGRALHCLAANEGRLSQPCRQALTEVLRE
jgi:hypothetical protein